MILYVTSNEMKQLMGKLLFSGVSFSVTWPGNVYEIPLGPINTSRSTERMNNLVDRTLILFRLPSSYWSADPLDVLEHHIPHLTSGLLIRTTSCSMFHHVVEPRCSRAKPTQYERVMQRSTWNRRSAKLIEVPRAMIQGANRRMI